MILELDLVKRSDLDAANRRATDLETGKYRDDDVFRGRDPDLPVSYLTDLSEVNHTLTEAKQEIQDLMSTCKDFEDRLGSGEYNTKIWRAIELRDGPAAREQHIRKDKLEALQAENQALLDQIVELECMGGGGGQGGDGTATGSHIPKETISRHQKELADQKAAADKRLQRLKEVNLAFNIRSREPIASNTKLCSLDSYPSVLCYRSLEPKPLNSCKASIPSLAGNSNGPKQVVKSSSQTFTHPKERWD